MGQLARRLSILRQQRRDLVGVGHAAEFLDGQIRYLEGSIAKGLDGDHDAHGKWHLDSERAAVSTVDRAHTPARSSLFEDDGAHGRSTVMEDL